MNFFRFSAAVGASILVSCPLMVMGQQLRDDVLTVPSPGYSRIGYPNFRPLQVQYDVLPARRVSANFMDGSAGKAKLQPMQQLRITGGVPLVNRKAVIALAEFSYSHAQGSFEQIEAPVLGRDISSYPYSRHQLAMSLTAIHADTLFRRPVHFRGTITGSSRDPKSVEKVTSLLSVALTMRRTPVTKLRVGVVYQVNPSSQLPVLPLFSYWHRFPRSAWEIDVLLPTRVALRRPLPFAPKGWLSVGSELTGLHFFASPNLLDLGPTSEINTTVIQTGLLLEHPITSHLWLGVRTGIESPFSAQVSPRLSPDETVDATLKPTGYVGVVLSVVIAK